MGIHLGHIGRDLDRLADAPNFHREVHARHLVHLQGDPRPSDRPQSFLADRDAVRAGREQGDGVVSQVVADGIAAESGTFVADGNSRPGHHGAGSVRDGTYQFGGVPLC